MSEMQIRATGIPWFRQEDYNRCRKLFIDGHKLPDTYQQWRKHAKGIFDNLVREGHIVEKVHIDPDSFPAWCAPRGLHIDADARIRFVNETVARKYRDQG